MCSSTGPKSFGAPQGLQTSGTFAPPVNYASSPQDTANVGSVAPPPPPATAPTSAPTSDLTRMTQNPLRFAGGYGRGFTGGGRTARFSE